MHVESLHLPVKTSPFRLLCFTGLFAIFSSTISKSPVLPLYATYLGAEPAGVGSIASISAFTGIVASIPAGLLSDRIGRKKMLVFASVVFATAPFLYLVVTELWQLALVRFYHGFATAIFIPVGMALVTDVFHAERGEKLGWFSTSTLLGRFVAPIAGGTIIGALAFNPGMSYRVVYLVCGAAGILTLLLMLRMPDPTTARGKSMDWRQSFTLFKKVITKRGILITALVEAAILFAYGTFETFLPLFTLQAGLSAYAVGVFLSAQIITLALTKPLMGRFSDRHGRPPQIIAGVFLGAAGIAGMSLASGFFPLLGLSIIFGLSLSIVTSATAAFVADLSARESRGSAMGILGSVMDIGHTIGPLSMGIVASYLGIGKAFLGAALVLVIMAMVFWATLGATGFRDSTTPG